MNPQITHYSINEYKPYWMKYIVSSYEHTRRSKTTIKSDCEGNVFKE